MADEPELVQYRDLDEDLVEIAMNDRTAKNALSSALVAQLRSAIARATIEGRNCVILTSTVRVFSAGFHLGGIEQHSDADLLERFVQIQLLLEDLENAPFASIAVLEGPAVGAGADLALAADFRVATDSVYFKFPGAGFGVVLGTGRLAELAGPLWAARLTQLGQTLRFEDALRLGIVHAVDSDDVLISQARSLAGDLGRLPKGTVLALRRASSTATDDKRLADLVRSAARPGLANRIRNFANTAIGKNKEQKQ